MNIITRDSEITDRVSLTQRYIESFCWKYTYEI